MKILISAAALICALIAPAAHAASCEDALFNPYYGVFQDEGGFQNRRNDAGNWSSGKIGKGHMCGGTKYGLACAYHSNLDIAHLTKRQAADEYGKNECRALRISDLKGARDPAMLLGLGINQGAGTAVKNLKEVRNAFRRIKHLEPLPVNTTMDDGIVEWFNEFTRDDEQRLGVLFAMSLLAIDRALDIVDSNPRQAENLFGWVQRWDPLNYK